MVSTAAVYPAGDASLRVLSAVVAGLLSVACIGAGHPASANPAAPLDSAPATARFVGPYAWVKLDPDSSGLADQLRFDGFVEVRCAPGETLLLSIEVGLYRNSTFITYQPGDNYAAMYDRRYVGRRPAGRHAFSVAFGGEAIRRLGKDGPYAVHFSLVPRPMFGAPPLDRLVQDSPPYSWREFSERGVRFREVLEWPVDVDGDGLHDSIQVAARLDAPPLKPWRIQVHVKGRDYRTMGVDYARATVPAGDSTAQMTLDASEFRRLQADGPYVLDVAGLSGDGEPDEQGAHELRTRPYHWTELAPPAIRLIEGRLRSRADEAAGTGTAAVVLVEVPVEVQRAGRFACHGAIRTGPHAEVTAGWGDFLARGTHAIPLRFSACPLLQAGLEGPIRLERLEIGEVGEWGERTLVDTGQARTAEPIARWRFAPCDER
jgi:hypothetical protein